MYCSSESFVIGDELLKKLEATDFVRAIIASAPDHCVRGKKRLQKFAYLLTSIGAKSDANFIIWDYGPYSREIASAAEYLTAFGYLNETEEQVGQFRTFTSVYSSSEIENDPKLEPKFINALSCLSNYSNIELEVAATIQFFIKSGKSPPQAIGQTKQLKPTKSSQAVVERSLEIIDSIEAIA